MNGRNMDKEMWMAQAETMGISPDFAEMMYQDIMDKRLDPDILDDELELDDLEEGDE